MNHRTSITIFAFLLDVTSIGMICFLLGVGSFYLLYWFDVSYEFCRLISFLTFGLFAATYHKVFRDNWIAAQQKK